MPLLTTPTGSPLQSSYLTTKDKSSKKRKSIENGESGKKKQKKQRRSLNPEEEFDGFSDAKMNGHTQEDIESSMVDVNREDEVQGSSKKSKNGKKRKSKKYEAPAEADEWENIADENGVTENGHDIAGEPHTDAIIAHNIDMVEPPSSKKKKKNRKKYRKSLEFRRQTDDIDLQVAEQLRHEEGRDAAHFVSSEVKVTAESVPKSEKKVKKPISSSPPPIVRDDMPLSNEELLQSMALSVARSAKKKKKRSKKNKGSLGSEDGVLAVEKRSENSTHHDAAAEDVTYQEIVIPSSLLSPKEVRKLAKASKQRLLHNPEQDIPEALLEHQSKPLKSKKNKEQSQPLRSQSRDANATSRDSARVEVPGYDDTDIYAFPESPPKHTQGKEIRNGGIPSGAQPRESQESQQITGEAEQEESVKKSKSKKDKSKALGKLFSHILVPCAYFTRLLNLKMLAVQPYYLQILHIRHHYEEAQLLTIP